MSDFFEVLVPGEEPQQPSRQSLIPASDAQLAICVSEFGFDQMGIDELLALGVEELNASMLRECRAGAAFWAAQEAIKNTSPTGGLDTFKDFIERNGLIKQRVYEAISLAKCFTRLPDNQRQQLLNIGKKKALLLAKIPQDEINRLAESGTDVLDDAETMTYDQLRDLLKTAERRNQQLNAEVEHRDAIIDKFKKRDNRDYEFHWKTHTVRDECLAYQAECEVALNSLQAVFNEQLNDIETTERSFRFEQLWVTANVIAARAALVIDQMRDACPVDLPDAITSKHMLTDDEAQRWLLDYPLIERKHEAAKAKREDARPNRPGRPSKKDK
ncbi:hypothetical protein ACQE3D_10770 [Methylomonas sp. MS20]|uniref:hypothetical protein n=1 Tax=unclassified Methylomonas TaxID=2608980 RepID=UPI0028A37144|nr:hypothetical protein [Methylomonas sp. MV1]MDT4328520.1 hypothetical protein [Methylomonas sp. MV1]